MPTHCATHCSTVQHSATHCLNIQPIASWLLKMAAHPATHCRTPQHTTIHCSTPTFGCELIFENVSKPYNTLQQTTTHSNNLQYRLLRMFTCRHVFYLSRKVSNLAVCLYLERWGINFSKVSTLQCVAVCCSALQRVVLYCSMLQCVAVCCRVLQSVSMPLPIFALRASTILKTQHYGCLTWRIESRLDFWISTNHVGVRLCMERQKFWKVKFS